MSQMQKQERAQKQKEAAPTHAYSIKNTGEVDMFAHVLYRRYSIIRLPVQLNH